jgi:hypothetical protein
LINSTWYKTGDIFSTAENKWESGAERWDRLDGGKSNFADMIAFGETEDTLGLAVSYGFLNFEDVPIKRRTLTANRFSV